MKMQKLNEDFNLLADFFFIFPSFNLSKWAHNVYKKPEKNYTKSKTIVPKGQGRACGRLPVV